MRSQPCTAAVGSGSFLLDAWMAQVGQAVFPKGRSWAVRMMSVAFGYGPDSALVGSSLIMLAS